MFKKTNRSNIGTFCLAFVIAVLLWLIATAENDPMIYQRIENIPISYINTEVLDSKNLIVTDLDHSNVSVRIYGRSVSVNKLNKNKVSAEIDLSEINSAGMYSLEVNIKGISDNIIITDISPKIIKVAIEDVEQESINTPVITGVGTPGDNYVVLSINSDINDIAIKGARSKINKIDKIVGNVDVTGKKEDFTQNIQLKALDDNGNEIADVILNPSIIEVNVLMGISKKVNIAESVKGNVKKGYYVGDIVLSPSTVTIVGKKSIINKITNISTEAIDVTDAEKSFERNVSLKLPSGVSVSGGINSIHAKISIDPVSKKSVWVTSFTFTGLNDNYTATVSNDNVQVVFTGEQSLLDKINSDDIVGVVDVNNLTEGVHSLPLTIRTSSLPSGVSINEINNKVVEVKITSK